METDVIVFAALKIKKDNAQYLPRDLCGWTNSEECDILCDMLQSKLKKRIATSMYYLDRDNYAVEDTKIKPAKKWDSLVQDYIICFSIDMLRSIFGDQEFVSTFLTRVIELHVDELQKCMDQSLACLEKIKSEFPQKVKQYSKEN